MHKLSIGIVRFGLWCCGLSNGMRWDNLGNCESRFAGKLTVHHGFLGKGDVQVNFLIGIKIGFFPLDYITTGVVNDQSMASIVSSLVAHQWCVSKMCSTSVYMFTWHIEFGIT